MKMERGEYDGASLFAEFDRPVVSMSHAECMALLECILDRASPSEEHGKLVYSELGIAEELFNVCWPEPAKGKGSQ